MTTPLGATDAGPTLDIDRLATVGAVAVTCVVTVLVLLPGFGSVIPSGKVTVAVFTIVTSVARTTPSDCSPDFGVLSARAAAPGAVPTIT